MDEDMMGMEVAPVMMPDQQMMQGTPAAPSLPNELQVEEFLKQIGMTLEELEMAEEMFGMGEGALGFTI